MIVESSVQESSTGCFYPATYLLEDNMTVRYVRCSHASIFLWLVPSELDNISDGNYGTICLYDFSTRSHRLQRYKCEFKEYNL